FEEGLQIARRRTRCRLVRADVLDMPFTEPFQVVGAFDVLEHLPDDRKVLRALRRHLAADGRLVLTVPAHMALWSHFDEFSGHCRRYSMATLRQALGESGFEVEYLTPFMAALFPLVWLGRKAAALFRRRPSPERARELSLKELRVVPVLNGLLRFVLGLELPLLGRRWRLPLGTSPLAGAPPPPPPPG